MNDNKIDFKRMYYFFLRTISLHYKWLLVSGGTIATALLFVTLISLSVSPSSLGKISGFYHFAFIIGGLVFTSKIFNELNNPLQNFAFLTLPVSTLEKIIVSWFISSPVYIIAFTSLATLVMFLASLITMKFGFWNNYLETITGSHIYFYLFIQTFFFLGACYFKKNILMKTMFFIFFAMFIIGIYGVMLGYFIFGGFNHTGFVFQQHDTFKLIIQGLLLIIGPYMLLVSYYKLKERQSS